MIGGRGSDWRAGEWKGWGSGSTVGSGRRMRGDLRVGSN